MTTNLLQTAIEAKNRLFKSISFNTACVASILVHALFFLVLSLCMHFFETSSFYKPPLIFDFIFMPTDELHDSNSSREIAEISEAVHKGNKNAQPENVASKKSDNQHVPTQPVSEFAEEVESFDELKQDTKGLGIAQYMLNTIEPTSLTKPRPIPEAATSVKVAMTRRQQKMLMKKIKKWSEDFHKMELPDSTLTWEDKGVVYTAKFSHQAAEKATDIDELVVEIGIENNGTKLTSELRMKRLAFSNFAQFVDYWDPNVAIHDDVLEGRFHSNTKISLMSKDDIKPEFHGKVTTASYDIHITQESFSYASEESLFLGGLETGVRSIHLPKKFMPLATDSTILNTQQQSFSETTWITFSRDGFFFWKTETEMGRTQIPSEKPFYILGSKKKKLHLQGVLNGMVLVYSPGKIVIDDDITYAQHPAISVSADDYLGIVSDKDIEIAPPSVTGPGDLNVFAAIYAKKRFRVPNRRGKRGSTLFIYGSLTAGSLSATEPRYATRIRVDKRLEQQRPPSFPLTDRYEMTGWEGTWKVTPN